MPSVLTKPRPDGAPAKQLPPLEAWDSCPPPRVHAKPGSKQALTPSSSVLFYRLDSKEGVTMQEPRLVKLGSPRLRAALEETGMVIEQLGPQPEHGPFGWAKVRDPHKARLRSQAWEGLRSKNLALVMQRRGEAVAAEEARYQRQLKAQEGGGFGGGGASIAEQLAEQRSSMIAAAEDARRATTEATARRIADVERRVEEERSLASARAEEVRRVERKFDAEKAAQRRAVAAQRRAARRAALEREESKAARYEREQEEKASKLARFAEAEAARTALEARKREEYRARSLAFARKHARKLVKIRSANEEREEARVTAGEATALKLAESEQVRRERVRARQAAQAAENAERTKVAAERLARHRAGVEELEAEKAARAAEHAEVVAERLRVQREAAAREVKRKQAAERREAFERAAVLEEVAQRQVLYEGELASAAEAKERVIEAAQQRRARQLTVKAEESRLSFALKRDFVDRKRRIEQARRRRAEERCMEKAAYTDGVRLQKQEYVATRRQEALAGQFEMSCLFASAKDPLRPATAPAPSAWELRAAELREMSSSLSLPPPPGAAARQQGRGELSVTQPSLSNGWVGQLEASVALQPLEPPGAGEENSRPGAARPVSSLGRLQSGKADVLAVQGGGALVGRARLAELAADEVRTQGLVGRVRSRASLGEGWRLYAPAAHVGLGCETKHNVIEKQSFSNGKFT